MGETDGPGNCDSFSQVLIFNLIPQIFLTGTFYVLNQTGKQLFYESAWKSLLHSETAAFDCFSVAGDGI